MNNWYDSFLLASKRNQNDADGWLRYISKSFSSNNPPNFFEVSQIVASGKLLFWQEIILKDAVMLGTNTNDYVLSMYESVGKTSEKEPKNVIANFIEIAKKAGYKHLLKKNVLDNDENIKVFDNLIERNLFIEGGIGSGRKVFQKKYVSFLLDNLPEVDLWLVDLQRVEFNRFRDDGRVKIFENEEDIFVLIDELEKLSALNHKTTYIVFDEYNMILDLIDENTLKRMLNIIKKIHLNRNVFFVFSCFDSPFRDFKELELFKKSILATDVIFKNKNNEDIILEHSELGVFKIVEKIVRYHKIDY